MSKGKNIAAVFIAGGFIGSAISLLYAPKKGSDMREDIRHKFNHSFKAANDISWKYIKQARQFEEDLVQKADNIYKLVKSYAEGKYNGTVDKFENEFTKLKRSFQSALETYNRYGEQRPATTSIVEEIFSEYEDEKLPKTEGMKRRADIKVK
ncbi:MAG: YtxH domain-containing protein [Bacteroidota bacterium]|nr:YtxH domain-containing protein [Bacteroidota bacterium]